MKINPYDLNQEYTQTLSEPQCQSLLKELENEYDFDKPIKDCYTHELDHVINSVLYIEDRQRELMYIANGQAGAAAGRAQNAGLSDGLMAIMTPKGRVASIAAAAEIMGLSTPTIRVYLNTKKTEYYRCP